MSNKKIDILFNNYYQIKDVFGFLFRWFLCSFSLWIVIQLFGHESTSSLAGSIATYLLAGLIFSFINAIVKPVIFVLSIPFVLVTMGLFTILINGFMVWLTIVLAPNLHMSFFWSIISSFVLSLINYVLNNIGPRRPYEEDIL